MEPENFDRIDDAKKYEIRDSVERDGLEETLAIYGETVVGQAVDLKYIEEIDPTPHRDVNRVTVNPILNRGNQNHAA